jgi:uncharacterized protein (DUF342 family)
MGSSARDGRDDDLLRRLEKQLEDLEVQEIVRGSTDEDLQEKGFVGDKNIEIARSRMHGDSDGDLSFEPGVEHERFPDGLDFDDLGIADVVFLRDVEARSVFATCRAGIRAPVSPGANVLVKKDDSKVHFVAAQRGKAVIIGDALHIFPSDIDCTIAVEIDEDAMCASVRCTPGHGRGTALSLEAVKGALVDKGVCYGVMVDEIERLVNEANSSLAEQRGAAARARPPVDGRPGEVRYAFNHEHQEYDFRILPDGRIDYKSGSNIIIAKEGQQLASVTDPTPGKPGVTVLGKKIPPAPGAPATLTAGKGVRVSEDGKNFYSEINGSITLNGSLLEVLHTYVVNGDVDYATGNIDFNGTVFIGGNVTEGFCVRADGDVVIMKNADSSRIEAGRDVVVKGGIQGKGKGLVAAGRAVHAAYAQNARIEAQGAVILSNFAVNSQIYTSRQVRVTSGRGAIIGGETYAQRGVEARSLGSEAGVKTFIEAGTDFLALKKIAELDEEMRFARDGLKKIDGSLKAVAAAVKKNPKIAANAHLVKRATQKRAELEKRYRVMEAKRVDLVALSHDTETCFVKVRGRCYSDVQIKIRESRMTVSAVFDHVRFYEDRKAGMIKAGAY